jgi:uncharacterized protein YuzE
MGCRVEPGNDEEEDKAMRVRVDHAADAVYLNLTDRPIKDSAEVADGIVVDYDDAGRIVGIEILDASKRTDDPEVLKQFSFELPTVG